MLSRMKDAHVKTESFDVHIVRSLDTNSTDLWVIDKRSNQRGYLTLVDGKLTFTAIVEGSVVPFPRPTLLSFPGLETDLVYAIAEAFTEIIVDRPTDSKIQGLYEAQSKHLEDMRTLVFKGEKQ